MMTAHEQRQFAISVAWTWPVVIVLLIFAMVPIWAPIIPPLAGLIAPVTGKVTFIEQTPVEGGLTTRMSYYKNLDCELLSGGVSVDRDGVPVLFEPVNGSLKTLVTKGTGPQISQLWFLGDSSTEGLRLRWIHRCNPYFLTVTVAYP